jgi:hypothetical protein
MLSCNITKALQIGNLQMTFITNFVPLFSMPHNIQKVILSGRAITEG